MAGKVLRSPARYWLFFFALKLSSSLYSFLSVSRWIPEPVSPRQLQSSSISCRRSVIYKSKTPRLLDWCRNDSSTLGPKRRICSREREKDGKKHEEAFNELFSFVLWYVVWWQGFFFLFLPAPSCLFECPAKGYKNQVTELGKGTRDDAGQVFFMAF